MSMATLQPAVFRLPLVRWARRGALGVGLLIAGLGLAAPSAIAAPTTTVDLGQASTYAALSGASVGNTVSAMGAPHTTLRGDLGVNASSPPTGFPPGIVTGTTRVGSTATPAYNDAVTAYGEVAGRTGGAPLAGALVGTTISPGLYTIAGAASNTGTVTLDGGGDPNAIFVFQIGGALTTAAPSQVVLINGAQASHVFWQVDGAASIGAGSTFAGTLIAHDAVAVGNNSIVNGRAFALYGALTLDDDQFYSAPPTLTISGGATASTTTPSPTISGTTDVDAPPGVVTVTINGQPLPAATPSGGNWSVTPAGLLADGTYSVVASTTDGAGNVTTTTQQLTVDTVPPAITLTGGASAITNNPTPTIAGTSDVAAGTIVDVTVDSQALTASVQSTGHWSVIPATLADATYPVTATVSDPAGNHTTASQNLTVDTTAPAVTITGGANALTNDPAPNISGTAAVTAGTTVTVTLADQTLTAPVQPSGAWTVAAAPLSDGPHRIIMSVSDAAGNLATFTQWLTVDTIAPNVTITGGATTTTSSLVPTITGTCDAAPGTTVTLTIAGQTLTTLLQSDGTWNVTPTTIGAGVWPILASASDPAGNIGTAQQILTIATPSGSGGSAPASGTGPTTGTGPSSGPPSSTGSPKPTTPHLAVSLSAATYRVARGKQLTMRFRLSSPAKVTLTLTHGKALIATLTTTRRKAGRGSLTWNGKIKRKLVPEGAYKLTLRAVSPHGTSARDTATLRIT
jgi:hypothetical protein